MSHCAHNSLPEAARRLLDIFPPPNYHIPPAIKTKGRPCMGTGRLRFRWQWGYGGSGSPAKKHIRIYMDLRWVSGRDVSVTQYLTELTSLPIRRQ